MPVTEYERVTGWPGGTVAGVAVKEAMVRVGGGVAAVIVTESDALCPAALVQVKV
jgi:hypothetical protein